MSTPEDEALLLAVMNSIFALAHAEVARIEITLASQSPSKGFNPPKTKADEAIMRRRHEYRKFTIRRC
jgi:hypothetical protein